MNFEDESYVRLYTRNTLHWLTLRWEGQAIMLFLLKGQFDRMGMIDIEDHPPEEAIAALTGLPLDVVKTGWPRILEREMLELRGSKIIWPKFLEAQTATKTPRERQAEHRRRTRDLIRSGIDPKLREAVVYFVQSENGGPIKIGRADDLAKRLSNLGTGRPDKLILLGAFKGTRTDERALHDAFSKYREKGEWFSPAPEVLAAARLCAELGREVVDLASTGSLLNASRDTSHVTPRDTKQQPVTPGDVFASPVPLSLAQPSLTKHRDTPPPIQDLTGSTREQAPPVVVGGSAPGPEQDIDCPPDLKLTDAQRAQFQMGTGASDYQVEQLELRFRLASEGADRRPLSAWLKCLGKAVASEFSNGRRRPPRAPEPDSETRLKHGQRQPNAHDHTDRAEHLATIGATEI